MAFYQLYINGSLEGYFSPDKPGSPMLRYSTAHAQDPHPCTDILHGRLFRTISAGMRALFMAPGGDMQHLYGVDIRIDLPEVPQ